MAAFLNKLVNRFSGKSPEAPQVYVCAFGKHPGYQDHFEHMPAGSQRLPAVWDLFYERGIKSLIGVWRQMPAPERIAEFNHVFAWCAGESVVMGRFWSSSDGASPPRKEFPLVVCAECRGLPLGWAVGRTLPALEGLERKCKETTSLDVVRLAIDSAQEDLKRQASQAQPSAIDDDLPADPLRQLATSANVKKHPQGLLRVLYHLERDWDGPRNGGANGQSLRSVRRTQQARVPALGSVEESITLWTSALLRLLSRDTSILVIAPQDQPWVDLIVGQPAPPNFACIRASLESIPLTTSIPYTLDPAFLACYGPLTGEQAPPVVPTPPAPVLVAAPPAPPPTVSVPAPPPAPVVEKPIEPPPKPFVPERIPTPPKAVSRETQALTLPSPTRLSSTLRLRPEGSSPKSGVPGEGTKGASFGVPVEGPNEPPAGASNGFPPRLYIGIGIAAIVLLGGYFAFRAFTGQPTVVARQDGAVAPVAPAPATKPAATIVGPTPQVVVVTPPTQDVKPQVQETPLGADPRLAWDGPRKLDALRSKLKILKEQYEVDAPQPLTVAIADAQQRMEQVRKFAWSAQNRPAVEEEIKRISADLAGHLATVDKGLGEQQEYAAWAKEMRGKTRIAASAAINEEWNRARDEAMAGKADHEATKGLVQSIQELLGRADRESAVFADAAAPLDAAVAAAAAVHREKALRDALGWIKSEYGKPASVGFKENLARFQAEQAEYVKKATSAMAASASIKAMLDDGRLLDEKIGDSPLRQVCSKWADDPILKEESIDRAVAPVRIRCDALLALEKVQDRAQILAAANAAKGAPELLLAAWQKVQTLELKAFSNLDVELALAKTVDGVFDSFKDDARRSAAKATLAAQKARLWEANARLAATDQQFEEWIARMADFAAAEQSIQDGGVRYNLALLRLKGSAAKVADDAAVARTIEQFTGDIGKVSALAGDAGIARLVEELKKTMAPGEGAGGLSGPPAGAGWSCQASADEPQYTWTSKNGASHNLKFVRVQAKDGGAFFLCQTEVSVGLFIDVVAEHGQWSAMADLAPPAKGSKSPAVSVWDWDKTANPWKMKLAAQWLSDPKSNLDPKMLYDTANGVDPGQPRAEHPMQQVPLCAAIYFARLVGCRLPTCAEWEQGYQRCEKASGPPSWNLRDRTWAVEYEHASMLQGKGDITELPLRGYFGAMDDDKSKVWDKSLKGPAGSAEDRYDDRTLWFRPVNAESPAPFKDLVGNVAEFACDDAGLWKEIAARPAAEVRKVVDQRKQSSARWAFVIGGSSMSSPSKAFTERRPLTDVDARFADVGLRLAFTPAGKPASERLKEVVAKQQYRLAISH